MKNSLFTDLKEKWCPVSGIQVSSSQRWSSRPNNMQEGDPIEWDSYSGLCQLHSLTGTEEIMLLVYLLFVSDISISLALVAHAATVATM
jgi:hypothetical protein